MSSNVTTFQHKTSVGNGSRVIHRPKGTSLVTTERGKESSARYHLSLTQDEIDSARGEHRSSGRRASPVRFGAHDGSFVAIHQGQTMILRMDDERRLRFTHRNRDGGITVTKCIG